MSNVLFQLLAQGIAAGVGLAESDKADLLAKANAEGITLENIAEKYADAAVDNAKLPAPLNLFPKSILVGYVNAGIAALVAQGQSREGVLFDLIIGWVQLLAQKLAAA